MRRRRSAWCVVRGTWCVVRGARAGPIFVMPFQRVGRARRSRPIFVMPFQLGIVFQRVGRARRSRPFFVMPFQLARVFQRVGRARRSRPVFIMPFQLARVFQRVCAYYFSFKLSQFPLAGTAVFISGRKIHFRLFLVFRGLGTPASSAADNVHAPASSAAGCTGLTLRLGAV